MAIDAFSCGPNPMHIHWEWTRCVEFYTCIKKKKLVKSTVVFQISMVGEYFMTLLSAESMKSTTRKDLSINQRKFAVNHRNILQDKCS